MGRIYVNNKLCSQKTLARNMVRSRARVYVSDPWHRPVNAWVWNMRYRQGSRGFRLSDFGLLKRIPRRGHHIGTLTTFSNFILEWYMTPLGKVSGWTSIVHFTRRSNCCHPYDRIPACFFHSRSYKLHCAANNPGSGNDTLDCNRALAHRRRSHIQLKVIGRLFRIYVNRRLCSSKHLRRNPVRLSNTKVYVSDPWYRNTNSYVWNMRYRRTRSEKRCRMERGFCVKRNGHDQNHGVVKLNGLDGNTAQRQRKCLKMCLARRGATGCEVIWHQGNRGCYVHTREVARGNNAPRHRCWIFSKCT